MIKKKIIKFIYLALSTLFIASSPQQLFAIAGIENEQSLSKIPKSVAEVQKLEKQASKELIDFVKTYKKIQTRDFDNTITNWNTAREKIINYNFLLYTLDIVNSDLKIIDAGKDAAGNLASLLAQNLFKQILPVVTAYLEKTPLDTLNATQKNIAYLLLSEIPLDSFPAELGKRVEKLIQLLSKYPMDGFTYLSGLGKEKISGDKSFSTLTLNVCSFAGVLPMLYGGPLPWKERIDSLTKRIKEIDADVITLQEVFDPEAGAAFYQRLKDQYSYFYINIGPRADIIGVSSGLFVASKYKIENPKFTLFTNREMARSYGFFDCDIKSGNQTLGHITTTHLQPFESETGKQLRAKELNQIVQNLHATAQGKEIPFFFCGDLNIQWGSNEPAYQLLTESFIDSYNKNRNCINKENCTSFDFTDYWWKANRDPNGFDSTLLVIDYALLLRTENVNKYHLETKRIPMGEITANTLPDTDHDGLFSNIKLIRSSR